MKAHISENFSIADISKETGIKESDIRWTLVWQSNLKFKLMLFMKEQKSLIKYNMGQMYLLVDEKHLDMLYK